MVESNLNGKDGIQSKQTETSSLDSVTDLADGSEEINLTLRYMQTVCQTIPGESCFKRWFESEFHFITLRSIQIQLQI